LAATTTEALEKIRTQGAPPVLLDFVRWAGPRLEHIEVPEAFFIMFQLCLSELAEGRSATGSRLTGSLVRQPLRVYAGLATVAGFVAGAYRGPEFAEAVTRAHIELRDSST